MKFGGKKGTPIPFDVLLSGELRKRLGKGFSSDDPSGLVFFIKCWLNFGKPLGGAVPLKVKRPDGTVVSWFPANKRESLDTGGKKLKVPNGMDFILLLLKSK